MWELQVQRAPDREHRCKTCHVLGVGDFYPKGRQQPKVMKCHIDWMDPGTGTASCRRSRVFHRFSLFGAAWRCNPFALFICVGLVPLSTPEYLSIACFEYCVDIVPHQIYCTTVYRNIGCVNKLYDHGCSCAPQTDREPPSIMALFLGGLPQGGGTWNRLGQWPNLWQVGPFFVYLVA